MTFFELFRLITFPLMPPLLIIVNRDLRHLIKKHNVQTLLDVGARKSPYTIGLPVAITILDLARETDLQKQLNLGFSSQMLKHIRKTRSNVKEIRIEDFLFTNLPDASFDAIVAVEVIEHVEDDFAFLRQANRLLRPHGFFYLTTPNGQRPTVALKRNYTDHKRHYSRSHLISVLQQFFPVIDVRYAVKISKFRKLGLPGYTFRHPLRTIFAIIGNVLNRFESSFVFLDSTTAAHLIAIAKKT